jgi:hypothetical protein
MSDEHYMSGKQAQARLNRSERQVRNYAADGRLRTRRRAGRVEYHAGDVDKLAAALRPETPEPQTDIMPAGELLNHIRDLEGRLQQASAEIGYYRGLLETQRLELEESREARKLLTDRESEARALEREITLLRGDRTQRGRLIVALVVVVLIAVIAIAYLAFIR